MAKLHVFEPRKEIVTGLVWDREFDRCILSPSLFNLYAEYIMRRAMADWPEGLPVGGYNVNNLRYADDTTLIATSVADMAELGPSGKWATGTTP